MKMKHLQWSRELSNVGPNFGFLKASVVVLFISLKLHWLNSFSKTANRFLAIQKSLTLRVVVVLFSPDQCCWSGSHFCFNGAEQHPVFDETEKFRLFSAKLILILFHHRGFFLRLKKGQSGSYSSEHKKHFLSFHVLQLAFCLTFHQSLTFPVI